MTKTIFSLKTLAVCWGGLLGVLGSGAVALQLTAPPTSPVVVAALTQPAVTPTPVLPAIAPAAVAAPAIVPMPFENRSLVALLPPPAVHAQPRVSERLPLPPIPPPMQHVAHAEPRRVLPVYAAQPVYDPDGWGRAMPYPGVYVRARPYGYGGPRTYYGW